MPRLLLCATLPALIVLASPLAHADPSAAPVRAAASVNDENTSALPAQTQGTALPDSLMRVLDVLAVVGVAEIDKSSALVSRVVAKAATLLPVRAPTWLSPEPPKTPLLYSRLMQVRF